LADLALSVLARLCGFVGIAGRRPIAAAWVIARFRKQSNRRKLALSGHATNRLGTKRRALIAMHNNLAKTFQSPHWTRTIFCPPASKTAIAVAMIEGGRRGGGRKLGADRAPESGKTPSDTLSGQPVGRHRSSTRPIICTAASRAGAGLWRWKTFPQSPRPPPRDNLFQPA